MTALEGRRTRTPDQTAPGSTSAVVAPSTGRPRGTPRRRRARIAILGLVVLGLVAVSVVNPVAVMAALFTGMFNIAGGGGAVISFLALTALGVPALTAHATGQFVTPFSFVSMLGLVREYWPGGRLLAAGGLGTVAGVVLVKLTPPATVQLAAPYVLLVAGLLIVFQAPVQRRVQRIGWTLGPKTTIGLLFAVGVYAGMIGVGTGTLALVVLGLTSDYADLPLQRLILTRNVLLLGMAVVVSIVFIATGLVSWALVAVLALPGAVGGWIALRAINRLPVNLLRGLIAAAAAAGALWMWLR